MAILSIMTGIGDCAKLLRDNGDGLNVRHNAKRQRTWFRILNNSIQGHPEDQDLFQKLLRTMDF